MRILCIVNLIFTRFYYPYFKMKPLPLAIDHAEVVAIGHYYNNIIVIVTVTYMLNKTMNEQQVPYGIACTLHV